MQNKIITNVVITKPQYIAIEILMLVRIIEYDYEERDVIE